MIEIRTDIQLERRVEPLLLHTRDGLTLVGELSLPLHTAPKATVLTFHPLPTAGGFMDSHIIKKAAYRLPQLADLAVVRFNGRGATSPAGTSQGSFDEGRGERFDVLAAMDWALERGLPHIWMFGWSFGTDLVIRYGPECASEGAFLLSPTLRWSEPADLAVWNDMQRPLEIMVAGKDEFLPPADALRAFSIVPRAHLHIVEDAVHLWVGERQTRLVLNALVQAISPGTPELVTVLPGNPDLPDNHQH